MNSRKQKAMEIMCNEDNYTRINDNEFKVKSQTDSDKHYIVSRTHGKGLICECLDHITRKSDCKHIKVILNYIKTNKDFNNDTFRIMERAKLHLCKFCDSGKLTKDGYRKNKSGKVALFKCKDCGKRFSINIGFENMRYDNVIITRAMQMYYTGMSVRDIANCYELKGIEVSHMTIYNWVTKYSKMVNNYVSKIVPRTDNRNMVRADEVWIKVAGKQYYSFNSMDNNTRYWITSDVADNKFQHEADKLLEQTRQILGNKSPAHFVTDGLPAYMKSSRKVFRPKTNHIRQIHIQWQMNNNMMERLNGEIRDREKVFRGLGNPDTPILDGMRVYYNYTKKHGGLKGLTPAQAALIEVDGKNKWKTLIENASLNKINE